jgi:sugar-phosphatase
MISDNKYFKAIKLKNEFVFNLGTPLQLNNFINKTFIFLFDLDGTLIITDDIYYDVWKSILSNYNIVMNYKIFTNYIQGKSDLTVLKNLIPNKYNELINTISNLKDDLFLQNINKIKIIDGIIDFILKIKKIGYKIGIVTNCNKKVALEILNKLEINNIIDKLVCGDDSEKPKPYPDPYLKAIKYFNSTNEKTIIFEDSKTGIQSAKNTFPKCIIGIETIYNSEELLICGVDLTIKNYVDLEINNILQYKNININKITEYVKASMIGTKIEKIEIDNNKLKGGFISDVIGLKIYTEYEILDCILKLENTNETFLSKIAHDLDLYEREYYFYETILKYIPIKTPKFYGVIRNNDFNKIGILMNNLVNLNYKLNLDLNKEKIDVSLKIIERLAQLHATFFDKDLKKIFNELKKHTDPLFNPSWQNFIQSKWINFKSKWCKILSKEQIEKTEWIVNNFSDIQQSLSDKKLTLCHGDVKSANIFYQQIDNGYEPYFIDWQYICEGKGVQDLVFFMIESFEIKTINQYKNIFKDYYYVKLKEYGVINYSREDYEKDFQNSIYYFPIFVAFWFGTLNEDELIDKNFPFFFIQRLYNFIE